MLKISSPLEKRIHTLYERHGITRPCDISLRVFDHVLPVRVIYRPGSTVSMISNGECLAFVDGHLPLPERRVVIAHEIGHLLLHAGIQTWLPCDARSKQEWQANRFAAYALAPSWMIAGVAQGHECLGSLTASLSDTFGVTQVFMEERIALYRNEYHSDSNYNVG
ncbi:MAG: ImmA/IrrE family metallo-endopeptidase [Acidibacillus sp.]|nr:ImmA/IrrE family metallo-endopeptidase [Acidibacillus sp.]